MIRSSESIIQVSIFGQEDVYSAKSVPSELKRYEYSQKRKNLKWEQEQHVLYLIFLEINKQKIRSKIIRRSNNFFQQMSGFLKSKTPIQCRSHHQKFQDKYKYPHRIIRSEKLKVPSQKYERIWRLIQTNYEIPQAQKNVLFQRQCSQECPQEKVIRKEDAWCQTDIQGTSLNILTELPRQINEISYQLPIYNYYSFPNQIVFPYLWHQ